MKVKNSAIIYTGYDYQTLQGVKLLAEWLCSPAKYTRVAFEADTDSNETPEGIDDIVCERPDGIKDFWQVKFSPTPEKKENHLTWDWLLKISGKTTRSRSIFKKLCDAIAAVPEEKLGDVILLTNKRPDRVMESCLCGSRIDFMQIEEETQKEIILQLGSVEIATFLLSKLTIQHSDGDYHTISRGVRAELLKLSDDAGVERLIARSREWAMFKNNPPENGWVYLHHVREILSLKRPEPIPEIFSLPEDYCLPNADFHKDFLTNITKSNGEVITLTGKPGAGKSTYLSFLCQKLEEQEVPLIRHHYFLSLGDTTSDRLSPRVVADSLLYQIKNFHGETNANTSKPEYLRDALITCANHYKSKGKPFVVLIDGLDHVWRDNAKNKKPLDETFRQLLPAINNLVILVGTQPVKDELLPNILLSHSPKGNWYWLPEMSGNSIYEFLKQHVNSGRLFLNCHINHAEEEIRKSARELINVTNGYPLHVIYSSEFLSHNGLALSSWQIEKLRPCTDGNITTYYSELWRSLSYRQRDVLHLCSGFQFAWPRQAIGNVVKDEHDYAPSVDAVAHMLSDGGFGVRPFHESLVVFVKSQEEHQQRINALLPSVCDWLSSEAPAHLKDNWLWSSQARAGDPSNLRQGLTRDWVLDRLITGMPVKSFIRLFSEAEIYALQDLDYAEAYSHRALKTRLINGPEFQTWNLTSLETLSLVAAERLNLNDIVSEKNEYSPLKLSILSIALWHREEPEQAEKLAEIALDRYRARTKLLSSEHSTYDETESSALIKASVLTNSLNYDVVFEDGNFSSWPSGYVASFRKACRIKKDLDLLLRGWNSLPSDSEYAGQIELDAIRLSILEDVDITCRPEYTKFENQHLSCFVKTLLNNSILNVATYYFDGCKDSVYKVAASKGYHEWFFHSIDIRLNAVGNFSWLPIDAALDRVDVSVHYELLNNLTDKVASHLLAGNVLNFESVCLMFPSEPQLDKSQWDFPRSVISLKRSWVEIAADCHLITTKSEIAYSELKYTIESGTFRTDWLRLWYKEVGLKLLSDDAARLLIDNEEHRQLEELEETIEYCNAYIELAEIALQHNQLDLFEKCLRKTWDFVLGYGHHKDPTIFGVLKAVEFLSNTDRESSLAILERISPIIFNISEFTDGDETRHSKHSISSLVAKINPQTAASIYDQELRDGEWYYSEETIVRLLEECDFSTPIAKQLYLTGLHSSCYELLRTKVESGNVNSIQVMTEIDTLLDNKNQILTAKKHPKTDDIDEKITLLPSDYPPEKFKGLVAALKGKYSTNNFWTTWYTYWVTQGKEFELLQQLMPSISTFSDSFDDRRYLLDLLFTSERKLNGKAKAFKLLVVAHNAMNGWSDWYERSENTIDRLKLVAEQYPNRVDEFIKLTTSQPDSWKDGFGDLIIPNDKLVYLLSHAGRVDDALQLTLKMVDSLEESVRNLRLQKPEWDWRTGDSVEEALTKSLVSRLKLPIPSIKLWVIEQLSNLLVGGHPGVESLLQRDLADRKQESECVEVLCVFFIAKAKGYACASNLGCHIKARSTLSDLILSELVSNPKDFGIYAFPVSPFVGLERDNNRFEYYQGSHVPLLYNSVMMREEQKTGIPFTDYYKSEWNNTFKYQSASGIGYDYFFSGDRQRNTGQFYTQASHRGRSAYLRTIEVAKRFYSMPDSYAEQLSILALPIEPAYIGFTPKKPEWLPKWESESVNKENLVLFVKDTLINFVEEVDLLALSLPIEVGNDTWIDLTVVKATTGIDSPDNIKLDERVGSICIGNLLDKELSYEFSNKVKSDMTVLASTAYPFNRYGHWHSDLESRGLYIPRCDKEDKKVIGYSRGDLFIYSVDDVEIGFSSFWYNQWQPVHPKELRSPCGTFTAVDKKKYTKWHKHDEMQKQLYICNAKVLRSEDSYREHNAEDFEFFIWVDD